MEFFKDAMHDTETEIALLGTAINNSQQCLIVAEVPASYFTDRYAVRIHEGLRHFAKEHGGMSDLISLDRWLESAEYPDMTAVLLEAMHLGFMPAATKQYIGILRDCYKRRMAQKVSETLMRGTNDPSTDISVLLAKSIQGLQEPDSVTDETQSMMDAVVSFAETYDQKPNLIETGLADLDELIGGFGPGQLVVIGARPGVGKTALALNFAEHASINHPGVLLVSLEMSAQEIVTRLVAKESGINAMKITKRNYVNHEDPKKNDYVRIAGTFGYLSELKINISTKTQTPMQLRRVASDLKAKSGLSMIVVDYLQLMRADRRCNSRYEEVSDISRELKILAMELDVPIIALTQLNRASEGGADGKARKRRPSMAEAKDSGSIEQDANLFMLLWEPPEPTPDDVDAYDHWRYCAANEGCARMELIVEKNRQGPTGAFDMVFDKQHMKFICFDRTDREASGWY